MRDTRMQDHVLMHGRERSAQKRMASQIQDVTCIGFRGREESVRSGMPEKTDWTCRTQLMRDTRMQYHVLMHWRVLVNLRATSHQSYVMPLLR
jgi:hypothetical protein